jgi:hypothetical protein
LRISHGRTDILQLDPIYVDVGQVDGKKEDDDCVPTSWTKKYSSIENK